MVYIYVLIKKAHSHYLHCYCSFMSYDQVNIFQVDFEVETARGVLIQSCTRPTKGKGGVEEENQEGRMVECLLLSVTTPAALLSNPEYVVVDSKLAESKAVSLHLITWLTLTYDGQYITLVTHIFSCII